MTLIMTWGNNSLQKDAITAAATKVIACLTSVGIAEPKLTVPGPPGGYARCGFMQFDSVLVASQALNAYIEAKEEDKALFPVEANP